MSENAKPRTEAGAQKRRTTRAERRLMIKRRRRRALALSLLAAVVALLSLCGWQFAEYADFRRMRAAVEAEAFLAGTTVGGVDVSGLTLDEAKARWAEEVEPAYYNRAVRLSDGTEVTASMLGYESNYQDVLKAAYASGRSGGLEDRYEAVLQAKAGVEYPVSRALYTREGVDAFVRSFAAAVNAEPVAATASGLNLATYEFMFSGGTPGKRLNEEKLAADLMAAFDGGGTAVELDIEEVAPPEPTAQYGIISYMITDASSSSTARLHNIKTAMATINGTRLDPGEMFSFNEVVGPRTKDAGYRKAKAYYGMQDIMEYGGGICQVSSTLHAAALGAKLQIDERHEHGRRVWYIKTGLDATVDWGYKDLKFTNNRDEPIYIGCVVDDNDRVRIALFGKLEEGDVGLTEQQ
ncbi:MAG: hypothetical protein GX647_02215 [Clostridiales bacterium]|nr:hypothetical protein [Clostridiales bacterium]